MSQVDVSGIIYEYDGQGNRYVSNPYSIPVNMTSTKKVGHGLEAALKRVKDKIETKNRRPKYAMESSYWYKDNNGVTCVRELHNALVSFQCTVDSVDLNHIAKAFPNEYGGIDFKMLTARLFANNGDRRKYINLRQQSLRASQFPGAARGGAEEEEESMQATVAVERQTATVKVKAVGNAVAF